MSSLILYNFSTAGALFLESLIVIDIRMVFILSKLEVNDSRNNIQLYFSNFSIRSPTTRLIFITGFRSSGPTSKCHAHFSQIRTQIKIRTSPRYSYYIEFWEYTFYDGTFDTHYGNISYQVLKGGIQKII